MQSFAYQSFNLYPYLDFWGDEVYPITRPRNGDVWPVHRFSIFFIDKVYIYRRKQRTIFSVEYFLIPSFDSIYLYIPFRVNDVGL